MAKYTTQQLIQQFEKTHGDRYDYSLVEYVRSTEKVTIICRKHGAFEQLPNMHRKGQGCAACMYDGKRSTLSDILIKFKEAHGDRYDYSLVEYKNTDTKVKIICKEHGVFRQSPYHHQRGNGCPKCIGRNKTQEEVIELFREVHGVKYDYSLVEFKKILSKVKIVCEEHGVFKQAVQKHIAGQGCPKCSGTHPYTAEEALGRFREIHGSKYAYNMDNFHSLSSKIQITCPVHGDFEQQAFLHAGGSGCHKCAGIYQFTTAEIIEQFREAHGDKYRYEKVDYQGTFSAVEIICPVHGSFFQAAKTHKSGSGCPDCATPIGHTKNNYIDYCNNFDGTTILYIIKCWGYGEEFYKVGIARKGASDRFNSKCKLPYSFEVMHELRGDASDIWDLEKRLHRALGKYKYTPNMSFHGRTECFSRLSEDIYREIQAKPRLADDA